MGKVYPPYNHGYTTSHNRLRSHNSTLTPAITAKRVWVKREDGTPTTIMVGPNDIVDDLKCSVILKYPTTLAKQYDPSDLQLLLRVGDDTRKHKPKQSSFNRIAQESDDALNRLPSLTSMVTPTASSLILEPDHNVWDVLDEYFGGEMLMADAIVILAEKRKPYHQQFMFDEMPDRATLRHGVMPVQNPPSVEPDATSSSPVPVPQYHHPKPQHAFTMGESSLIKNKSVSPSLTSRLSPVNTAGFHKRSQSNPPISPSAANPSVGHPAKHNNGQAVLLLPKNFTLGEQNPLKRYSLDENMVSKKYGDMTPVHPTRGGSNGVTTPSADSDQMDTSKPDSTVDGEDYKATTTTTPEKKQSYKDAGDGSNERSKTPKDKREKPSSNGLEKPQPKTSKSVEKQPKVSTFERVLPSISVLVVEDNAINQAILGAFLRKHKIRYQIAKNGQEAVDKWKKGGFHLVLMDIQLPVKSGIEATKEIRHLEKVNQIGVFAQHELSSTQHDGLLDLTDDEKLDLNVFRSPVIIVALTASSNSSVDRKNALTAGCNDFLTKPVNLVWLQNKITEWGCMQALIDFDGWKVKRIGNANVRQPVMTRPHMKGDSLGFQASAIAS